MSCPGSSIPPLLDKGAGPASASAAELELVLATLRSAQAELDRLGQDIAAAQLDEAIAALVTEIDLLNDLNPM